MVDATRTAAYRDRAPWQARMLLIVLVFLCLYLVIAPFGAVTERGFVEDAIKVTLGALVGFITATKRR